MVDSTACRGSARPRGRSMSPLWQRLVGFGVDCMRSTATTRRRSCRLASGTSLAAGPVIACARSRAGVSFMEDRMEWHYLPLTESPVSAGGRASCESLMQCRFCDARSPRAADRDVLFLTGDLGFKALEPLREALGARFIKPAWPSRTWSRSPPGWRATGCDAWVYSIAPVLLRPALRADPQRRLPARAAGRAGRQRRRLRLRRHGADAPRPRGLRRAAACPTCGAYVPAFDADLGACVDARWSPRRHPAYLRLGRRRAARRAVASPRLRALARLLVAGRRACVVPSAGPLVGGICEPRRCSSAARPDALGCLPSCRRADAPPEAFLTDLAARRRLLVVEEHVAQGGVGQMLAGAPAARRARLRAVPPPCRARAISRAATARRSSTGASAASTRRHVLGRRSMRCRAEPDAAMRRRRLAETIRAPPGPDPGARRSGFVGANLMQAAARRSATTSTARRAAAGLAARGPAGGTRPGASTC